MNEKKISITFGALFITSCLVGIRVDSSLPPAFDRAFPRC